MDKQHYLPGNAFGLIYAELLRLGRYKPHPSMAGVFDFRILTGTCQIYATIITSFTLEDQGQEH